MNRSVRDTGSRFALLALAASLTLFALGTPLAKWLNHNGKSLGFEGEDAISFCNVLFVGNVCASMVVALWFGVPRILRELRQLSGKAWGILFLASGLSVAIPALMFTALDTTSVANVVLLGRVGPLLFAVAGTIVFGDRVSRSEWIGNGFVLVSLVVVVLAQGGGSLALGDVLSLLGGAFYAATVIAGRFAVRVASTPVYMFVRNLLSAIVFFSIAVTAYGWVHFADALHPRLWAVMAVYALIAVVLAQVAWYFALERVHPAQVGSFSILSPAMGILFAYAFLQEQPITAQWVALGLTSVGIVIAEFGRPRSAVPKTGPPRSAPETSLVAN